MEIAIAIAITNIVIALVVVGWCNKKINEFSDPERWKRFRKKREE